MNQEHFLQLLRNALQAIKEPTLYATQREYQAELLTQMVPLLDQDILWPGTPAVAEEFRKSAEVAGLKIKPDIIVHCAFDAGVFENRKQGNYVVLKLKRRATKQLALKDYARLEQICTTMGYAMGIFINVDASNVFLPESNGVEGSRLHGFAVEMRGGQVYIQEGHPYKSHR